MRNEYFQSLPDDVQQALGKSAFNAYIYAEPHFQFTGQWEEMKDGMKARWLTVAEAIFNQLQGLEETVTTKLQLFNTAQEVLNAATERFEQIRPDEVSNNYQLYETLRSALAEVDNARLLMLRANNEVGNTNNSGDGSTQKVSIPNVRKGE